MTQRLKRKIINLNSMVISVGTRELTVYVLPAICECGEVKSVTGIAPAILTLH